MWGGCNGAGFKSTGTGGVYAVCAKCWAGEGGAGLGVDLSESSGHENESGERIVVIQVVEAGGVNY